MARNRVAACALALGSMAAAVALTSGPGGPEAVVQAQPGCLAWFGSKVDGKCISWSMSSGVDSQINGVPITINGPTGESGTSNSGSIPGGRGSGLPRN